MNNNFRILLFWVCLIAFGCRAPSPTVIACVGDSITAGARVDPETESYPARLQALLGPGYEVVNLGVSSCTLLKKGRPTVWDLLPNIQATQAAIILISLGTNDTCGEGTCGDRRCWEFQAEFAEDYRHFIDTLRRVSNPPQIWICAPTPMVLETPGLSEERITGLTLRKARLQELISRIQAIATEQEVGFIDLNTPLDHRPDWFTEKDGVHPNAAGYQKMAKLVVDAIRP